MNFGHVLTTLCSLVALSCSFAYAEIEIPAHLGLKSTTAIEAYTSFMQKFDQCGDKENRTNNPYPVNDWLLSLPREKQASVVVYLYSLAESRCLDSERDKLIDTLESENEQHALTMLKKEGWLNIPVYGELATSKQDKAIIELTEDDKKALTQLTEQHYLPFNGIGMGELLFKFRHD
ncbi:hypothetical protein [Vibrio brasiliensis]